MLIDLHSPATQAEVAAVVGVTQQNISSLMAEGKLPIAGSIEDLVHAYCHRLREQAAGRMGAEIGLSLPGMHVLRWKFAEDELGARRSAPTRKGSSAKDRLRALNG